MNNEETKDLREDLTQILIIAHKVENEPDRKRLADICEKWLFKLKIGS